MKNIVIIVSLFLLLAINTAVSQTKNQNSDDEIKRLETLIKKERADNDDLNARRSTLETQLQNLNTQIAKCQNDKKDSDGGFSNQIVKLKDDNRKLNDKIRSLEANLLTQKENEQRTVNALSEQISDLDEDKKKLRNEVYKKSKVEKKKSKKRSRRRRR